MSIPPLHLRVRNEIVTSTSKSSALSSRELIRTGNKVDALKSIYRCNQHIKPISNKAQLIVTTSIDKQKKKRPKPTVTSSGRDDGKRRTTNRQSRENCWAIISWEKLSRQNTTIRCPCSLRRSFCFENFLCLFGFLPLLNNLVVLSHCHYAKLYSFHYKYGVGRARARFSYAMFEWLLLRLAPSCRR